MKIRFIFYAHDKLHRIPLSDRSGFELQEMELSKNIEGKRDIFRYHIRITPIPLMELLGYLGNRVVAITAFPNMSSRCVEGNGQ